MILNLSASDKAELKARHRLERDGRIRDRIKAVLAYAEGYSYSHIAEMLLLDNETIRCHVDNYFSEKKLSTANGGSEPKHDKPIATTASRTSEVDPKNQTTRRGF